MVHPEGRRKRRLAHSILESDDDAVEVDIVYSEADQAPSQSNEEVKNLCLVELTNAPRVEDLGSRERG